MTEWYAFCPRCDDDEEMTSNTPDIACRDCGFKYHFTCLKADWDSYCDQQGSRWNVKDGGTFVVKARSSKWR
jgi:hypothetical protein